MPRSTRSAALTAAHAAQQRAISATTSKQALALWGVVDPVHVDRAWPAVSRALSQAVAQGYAASTATAAGYLRQHAAEAGVDLGTILQAPALNVDQLETALRVTGPVAVKQAAAAGMSPAQAAATAGVRLVGAVGRLSQLGGRATIETNIAKSDGIVGWRRVGSGRSCFFCAMLISRGAAYKSEHTAGGDAHAFHDHCHCHPEPLYDYEDDPADVTDLYQKWLDATREVDGAAKVTAWRKAYDEHIAPLPAPSAILGRDLAALGDDELAKLLGTAGNDAEVDHVLAELDRRDEVARAEKVAEANRAKRRAQAAARREADQAARDAEYDRRIGAGEDPEQAYADVFGTTVERMRRDQAIAAMRSNGYTGAGFDELSRAAFRDYTEQSYFDAEAATRGHMLSRQAEARGVDTRKLFNGSEAFARANASEELLGYWQEHGGRYTLEDFRASILGGQLKVKGQAAWL